MRAALFPLRLPRLWRVRKEDHRAAGFTEPEPGLADLGVELKAEPAGPVAEASREPGAVTVGSLLAAAARAGAAASEPDRPAGPAARAPAPRPAPPTCRRRPTLSSQ